MGHRSRMEMRRGDTLYATIQVLQNRATGEYRTTRPGLPTPPGFAPVDITGFLVWFTAKLALAIPDAQALIRLDNVHLGGVTFVNQTIGVLSVTGSQLLTVDFPDGTVDLDYDLQIQDLRSNLFTVETGVLAVHADVTRALSPWVPGSGPGPIAPQSGGVGPKGPKGDPGDSGGGSYLPDVPPPRGTLSVLAVDAVTGAVSWQPANEYEIQSFAISGTGVDTLVEVGSGQPAILWELELNFTPLALVVTCTGCPDQSVPVAPGQTQFAGTFAGPFTSNVNGEFVALTAKATDPFAMVHEADVRMTYAVRVVWGSVSDPVVGPLLWLQLNTGPNNPLNPELRQTMPFASTSGQQQVFSTLASLGTPVLSSGGLPYPITFLGSAVVPENGTTQQMNFYSVGVPGLTFSWSMTPP